MKWLCWQSMTPVKNRYQTKPLCVGTAGNPLLAIMSHRVQTGPAPKNPYFYLKKKTMNSGNQCFLKKRRENQSSGARNFLVGMCEAVEKGFSSADPSSPRDVVLF
jgi:hypothetical protein